MSVMRRTIQRQSAASMLFGATLAFLSTWGLTQCSALLTCATSKYLASWSAETIRRIEDLRESMRR